MWHLPQCRPHHGSAGDYPLRVACKTTVSELVVCLFVCFETCALCPDGLLLVDVASVNLQTTTSVQLFSRLTTIERMQGIKSFSWAECSKARLSCARRRHTKVQGSTLFWQSSFFSFLNFFLKEIATLIPERFLFWGRSLVPYTLPNVKKEEEAAGQKKLIPFLSFWTILFIKPYIYTDK